MKKIIISLTVCAYLLACSQKGGQEATKAADSTQESKTEHVHTEACTEAKHATEEEHVHAEGEQDHTNCEGHDHANEAEHVHAEGEQDHANCEGHDHANEAEHVHAEGEHNHAAEAEHQHTADDGHDHSVGAAAESENSDEIVIEPAKAKELGIEVAGINPTEFKQIIKTGGQILAAQGDESTVVAPVAGIVSFGKTKLTSGNEVSKGAAIVTISAKGMVDGDPADKARITYETAKREFDRYSDLVKEKIVSEKEFNQVKETYETAKLAYDAIARQQTAKGNPVYPPFAGFVKNLLVNEGDYVEAGQPLLVVSQNRKLALRADVSERYYKDLKTIGSANFKTPYDNLVYRLSDLNGRLISFGKTSGTNSYYIPVTFEFDNKGEMIPGSFVEVFLESTPIKEALVIPVSALSEEQGLYFVYLQLDAECYKRQEVTLGQSNGSEVRVISGLNVGDKVVTHGALLVKLASKGSAIPEGHSHAH